MEKDRMKGSVRHTLESLVTHEFVSMYDESNPKSQSIKINRNGILAGDILTETTTLKNPRKYKKWSLDWYFLYYLAGLLLIFQVIKLVVELVQELWK